MENNVPQIELALQLEDHHSRVLYHYLGCDGDLELTHNDVEILLDSLENLERICRTMKREICTRIKRGELPNEKRG